MRISLGEWMARIEDGTAAAFKAYAVTHQNGLHIDIDDLGALNDRTPPSAWTGFDTDKRHEVENDVDLDVVVQHSGAIL